MLIKNRKRVRKTHRATENIISKVEKLNIQPALQIHRIANNGNKE